MNTSVQVKTHTNKSASFRNVENLRESEQFKNPNIEVLQKTPDYKFEDDVIEIPRADKKSEKERQAELRKVNNKINTYSKRLEVFRLQNNHKKVDSLTKQIEDLKKEKEDLKAIKSIPETRGKKREKNYVEFIFALTKSNKYIDNIDMQNVLKRAFERMKKTKVIKQLEGITGAMHLDQHSLHIHYIAKLPSGKTWDNIVNGGFVNNPEKTKKENAKQKKKISSKTYKNIQDTFQKFVKEEILKSEIKEKAKLVHFFHEKGKKYLPLTKYKKLNPLKNEIVENKEQINSLEAQNEVLSSKDTNLEEKIVSRANIDDLSSPKQIKKEKETDMNVVKIKKDLENEFGTNLEDLKNSDDYEKKSKFLDKFVEIYDDESTREESESSHTKKTNLLDKFKEVDKKLNEDEPQTPAKKRSVRKNR